LAEEEIKALREIAERKRLEKEAAGKDSDDDDLSE
jgi:hypothetical protein